MWFLKKNYMIYDKKFLEIGVGMFFVVEFFFLYIYYILYVKVDIFKIKFD